MAHKQTITLEITDPDDFQGGYLEEWDWETLLDTPHVRIVSVGSALRIIPPKPTHFQLFVKYGTDPHFTEIMSSEANGPYAQVVNYVRKYHELMEAIADNGLIVFEIREKREGW